VRGDICTICCGTEREVSVHCPLDCEYLEEARKHELPPVVDPEAIPNRDIRVSEEFLRDHEMLLTLVSVAVLEAALETPDVVDNDVREGLDSMVRTYRTLESGLFYESRPTNPIAAAFADRVSERIKQMREELKQAEGVDQIRDRELLGVLAFLQRMEIQQNNGRRLGRAFIDFLRVHFPRPERQESAPSLIV
jgi:hypothetical protein